mmetsp:Transcript_22702/g.43398  ORF Transcript_22702/g.43398 Transcript_22702/m.43398 type:complete len:183 (-) Transcript_22702:397-945(-)
MASHTLGVKIIHGLKVLPVEISSDSDFRDLKGTIQKSHNIPIEDQCILLNGKPMADGDAIYAAGVRSGSKLMLAESESLKQRKAEEMAREAAARPMLTKIGLVRRDVDKLQHELEQLESEVSSAGTAEGHKKPIVTVQEMLERSLCKLDEINGNEVVKDTRREQARRINALCERAEILKGKL